MNETASIYPRTGLTSLFAAGLMGTIALFGVFGGWAATTPISGAVIASGQIGVTGKPKTVQSLEGGIIAELTVAEGDVVHDGQILARLDTTTLRYELEAARKAFAGASARRARLLGERDHAERIDFAPTIGIAPDHWADAIADQGALFVARKVRRAFDRARFLQAADAINTQIIGVTAQIAALERQKDYLQEDLSRARSLVAKNALPQQRLTMLYQQEAALDGDIAARQAELAGLRYRQEQIEEDSVRHSLEFQEEVAAGLADVATEMQELTRAIHVAEARLDRSDIRAPVAGVVHEIQVTTLGGVLSPGGTLLQIVPQQSGLTFDVQVDPRAIDQVRPDQQAEVVIAGQDVRNTPKLSGRVHNIAPQAVEDRRSGKSFFRVALKVPETELARLPLSADLRPGVPIEAFLHTQDRTVLSYLAEPIAAHLRRGFRE